MATDTPLEDPTHRVQAAVRGRHRPAIADLLAREPVWARDFTDLRYEWRRLFSEVLGTFLLVMVGAGAPVVDAVTHGQVGRAAAVTAPALTVVAVILFMGAVSGAHLNPVVSVAFALRGDFSWRRVPGYIAAQVAGALLASGFLRAVFGDAGQLGATLPGPGFGAGQAFAVELVLTAGLVSTVLGTASTAQNLGPLSAVGVGAYITLAGLWASPVTGAAMNPARSLGPALLGGEHHDLWIYLTAPFVGAVLAVAGAYVLRGPGGGPDGSRAAQGTLRTPTTRPPADPHPGSTARPGGARPGRDGDRYRRSAAAAVLPRGTQVSCCRPGGPAQAGVRSPLPGSLTGFQRFILQGMYDNARATGVWTSVGAVPSTVETGPGVGLQEIADAVGVGVAKVREIPRHDSGYDPSVDRGWRVSGGVRKPTAAAAAAGTTGSTLEDRSPPPTPTPTPTPPPGTPVPRSPVAAGVRSTATSGTAPRPGGRCRRRESRYGGAGEPLVGQRAVPPAVALSAEPALGTPRGGQQHGRRGGRVHRPAPRLVSGDAGRVTALRPTARGR